MFPKFTSVIKCYTGKQSSSLLLVFHQAVVLQADTWILLKAKLFLFLGQIILPFMNACLRHEERDEHEMYVCINFLSSKGGRQQDRWWDYSGRAFLPLHVHVIGWTLCWLVGFWGFLCSHLSSFYCFNRIWDFWKRDSKVTQLDFLYSYSSYISLLMFRNYDWKN